MQYAEGFPQFFINIFEAEFNYGGVDDVSISLTTKDMTDMPHHVCRWLRLIFFSTRRCVTDDFFKTMGYMDIWIRA